MKFDSFCRIDIIMFYCTTDSVYKSHNNNYTFVFYRVYIMLLTVLHFALRFKYVWVTITWIYK